MKFEKIIKFSPAFDKRNSDPKKNYGIGAVKVYMVLKGGGKAVHFVFSTGMYLPKTHQTWLSRFPYNREPYIGYDVGYHDTEPHYEGQTHSQEKCEWLNGKPCYCDGSALRAEEFMKVLVKKGSGAVWRLLKKDLKDLLGEKK